MDPMSTHPIYSYTKKDAQEWCFGNINEEDVKTSSVSYIFFNYEYPWIWNLSKSSERKEKSKR